MASTTDRFLNRRSVIARMLNALPMAAAAKAYQDTYAGVSAGLVRPLVAGDKFAGVFTRQFDNSSGAASALTAEVENNIDVEDDVTGVTGVADYGKLVYATADDTLTLTAAGGSLVGIIRQHVTGTTCMIHLFTEAELAAF